MAILTLSSSSSSSPKQRKHSSSSSSAATVNRFLISVSVLGSAGPIRFVVRDAEPVSSVIDTALRSYAREGRRPVLGSDLKDFLLYCANAGSDVLGPDQTVGSAGSRNFVLCKKQNLAEYYSYPRAPGAASSTTGAVPAAATGVIARKNGGGGGIWKAWLHTLKITSH